MKWQDRRRSSNVQRRRSAGPSFGPRMGGGRPMGSIGCGGLIVLIILGLLLGINPLDLLMAGMTTTPGINVQYDDQNAQPSTELEEFLSVVLADTEDVWHEIFQENNMTYVEPTLHLYSGTVNSGCGMASSRMGPFYCSIDQGIYMDPSFYYDLKDRYGAPGDFAFAYVLAHEVGHHVQEQLGILEQVHALRGEVPEVKYNEYSVRLELQADYLAGVFANRVQGKGYLEQGDIEEAMNAAAAIGDDTLQKQQLGYADPDTFTHGTSDQRVRWFMRGFQSGTIQGGDTFNTNDL